MVHTAQKCKQCCLRTFKTLNLEDLPRVKTKTNRIALPVSCSIVFCICYSILAVLSKYLINPETVKSQASCT